MGEMEFPVEGATLNVEISGPENAPALLLWNGARCTLRMWDPVVAELKDRYRCFAIDTRGVGQSTAAADESQYSFEQYASDANQVLDAHGVDRCHV